MMTIALFGHMDSPYTGKFFSSTDSDGLAIFSGVAVAAYVVWAALHDP